MDKLTNLLANDIVKIQNRVRSLDLTEVNGEYLERDREEILETLENMLDEILA